jgi:folate-binding protein YgfZ
MAELPLHDFHERLGARFTSLNNTEAVADYGNPATEYQALRQSAAVLDFSFRSRVCLTGADRLRFLHGQVTNDINALRPGQGCYAALVTAKGKMQSDLNVFCLADELLLDFEPGFATAVTERLENYIVADDVQVVDVAALYGLLTVQGPKAESSIHGLGAFGEVPAKPFTLSQITHPAGEVYLMNHPRLGSTGFDLFVPVPALRDLAEKLLSSAKSLHGGLAGGHAFELARIEAGIPRFGLDMDESNIPLECGIEARAVSYTKGCYIGQEVLNRIHTLGHVNQELRSLRLAPGPATLPVRGDRLFHGDKSVGYITSSVFSPSLQTNIALGYVRREFNQPGTSLTLHSSSSQTTATIVPLPFRY